MGEGLNSIVDSQYSIALLWWRKIFNNDSDVDVKIFEYYKDYAIDVARSYNRKLSGRRLEISDLNHMAFIGLLDAIQTYQPNYKVPFKAYGYSRIKGAIIDGLSQSSEENALYNYKVEESKKEFPAVLDLELLEVEIHNIALCYLISHMDKVSDYYVEGRTERLALEVMIKSRLKSLPQRLQDIIHYHYLDGLTLTEIASFLGYSKARISQLHAQALNMIKRGMKL
ncbi:sigma-70 family RNA polymerase sigma factor [Woodsholea maritima]|uniref:sigma-70 family RNA polymerase sigma factor n=1 Tax=Woodsholea maritima TaxID=240237 RepID=UPI000382A8CE|nr:sigma-70 family RNA polymerase sigma factor [Woodsholea maritima]